MSSDKGMSMVGTVGRLCVFPNGINIIPEKVEMGIDIRDVVLENMESLRSEISKRVEDLKGKFNVAVEHSGAGNTPSRITLAGSRRGN